MVGAVWLRFRCELRTRWRAWLGLGLLVGVVAGAALVAAAGARRTASAPERFGADLHAADLVVGADCSHATAAAHRAPARCQRVVGALPMVADAVDVASFDALIKTVDGRSLQPDPSDPCYSGPGQVQLVGDREGRFGTALNRVRLRDGRYADPARADEVVIPAEVADRAGLHVGSRLAVSLYDGDCPPERATVRAAFTVRVVGVGSAPGEVPPTSGMFLSLVHVTPAFVAREPSGAEEVNLAVRLRGDARASELLDEMRGLGLRPFVIVDFVDLGESVARGVRPHAAALAVFAALLVLAGAIVLGQVVAHQTILESDEHGVLRALGMGRAGRVGVAIVRAAYVGTIAAVVAVAVGVAASPLMPIGPARALEPAPGVSVDTVVLVVGALATLLFVVLVSGVTAWVFTNRRPRPSSEPRSGFRVLSTRALAVPSAFAGFRFALGRTGSRRSAPVVTSLVAIGVSIVTVTGAITFGLGLAHLLDTPRVTGWNWDAIVGAPEVEGRTVTAAELGATLRRRPEVTSFTSGSFFSPFPQGRQLQLGRSRRGVSLYGFADGASIGPSVVRGRAPDNAQEVLVGGETLEELGLELGDRVVATGQRGTWDEPGVETRASYRIVGTGVLPFTDRIGRGASMTLDGIARLNPDRSPDGVFVRVAPGADAREVLRAVARDLAIPIRGSFFMDTRAREVFAEVRDLEEVDRAPLLFGLLMALVGVGVLTNVLLGAVRSRRRDLAVLRVLGFGRGGFRATVVAMACTYVAIAALVAVPVGLVMGRFAWLTFADRLHVVPDAPRPVLVPLLIVAGGLVVGALVAVPVARRMRRGPVASVLAGE